MLDSTVLVLGAGASLAYGMPLGRKLVTDICDLLPQHPESYNEERISPIIDVLRNDSDAMTSWRKISAGSVLPALVQFRQRLLHSDPKSIDEFLSRDFGEINNCFRLIGRLCIASVIADCEKNSTLITSKATNQTDDWYRYFWQECLNANSVTSDQLLARRLRIVSFNYDRSLEFFLSKRISATHLTPPGQSLEDNRVRQWAGEGFKFVEDKLQITHPYGSLGKLTDIEYGKPTNRSQRLYELAERIQVIGEHRANDDGFTQAREWIAGCTRLVFLGFSFDATNMERLGLNNGFSRRLNLEEGVALREVFPLTYGMERSELLRLVRQYFPAHVENTDFFRDPVSDRLSISESHKQMDITQYLRQYGALSDL